jgi:hypothetical protein
VLHAIDAVRAHGPVPYERADWSWQAALNTTEQACSDILEGLRDQDVGKLVDAQSQLVDSGSDLRTAEDRMLYPR